MYFDRDDTLIENAQNLILAIITASETAATIPESDEPRIASKINRVLKAAKKRRKRINSEW